jgi:6-phosphogluconolactonase
MNLKTFTAIFAIVTLPAVMMAQEGKNHNLLIGTYTSGKSEGIYVYNFDESTGEVTFKSKATGIENPSFLAISPNNKQVYSVVYAVSETQVGEASAFNFDAQSGTLKFINKVESGGANPCYITTDKNGKNVLIGNYTGGTLSVLPINQDGSLGSSVQTIQHEGSSINKERQEKAHVHSTVFTADNKYLLVGDLGIDKVAVYAYNPRQNKPLSPATPPFAAIKPGTGPRHIAFHPNNKQVYITQELTAEVTGFNFDKGKLTPFQTVPLTDAGFSGKVSAADIHISPDGKFLYASNRGDANEISIFSIDKSGQLKFAGRQSTLGKTPRNFSIDPSGNFLLVANQDTDNVVVFKRDKNTGLLTDTGKRIDVGNPVCLVFAPAK